MGRQEQTTFSYIIHRVVFVLTNLVPVWIYRSNSGVLRKPNTVATLEKMNKNGLRIKNGCTCIKGTVAGHKLDKMGLVNGKRKGHKAASLRNGKAQHSEDCECAMALTLSQTLNHTTKSQQTPDAKTGDTKLNHQMVEQTNAWGIWAYTPWQNGYYQFKADLAAKCSRFVTSYVYWSSDNNNQDTYQNKNRPATAGNTTSSASTPTRGGANSASNATAPTSSKSGNSSTTSGATKRSVAEQHAVEISRLEALCESRTKELNYVKMQLNQSAAGFEAMSVIFNYTANGLDALSCPAVKRQLEVTRLRLENTHLQLVELMTQRDALIEEIKGLKERQRQELERLQQEHGEALTTQEKRLQDDHQLHQDKLKEEHSEHIASIKTSHEKNLEEIAHKHESALEKVHKDHEAFLLLEKQRSKADIADLQQQHELALTDITKRFDNIKMTLSNGSLTIQEKVEQLRSESEAMRRRERECLAAYKADAEAQVSRAVTPYKHLPQEIDSLKAVLEMRNTEIRDLRVRNQQLEKQHLKVLKAVLEMRNTEIRDLHVRNQQLEQQLEELPKAMEKISQLEQKNENLEAVIKIKADNERQLSEKHSVLLRRYDKEAKANKRLSMDKDQLEWRLSHDSAALEVMLNRSISHSPPSSNNSTPEPTRRKKSPLPQQSPRSPRGGIAMEFFEPKSPRASPRTNGTNSLHRKQIRSADFDRPIPTLSNRHSSADLYASRPDRHSHDLDENDVMSTSQDDSVIMSVSTQSEPVAPRSPMSPSGGKTNLKRSGTYDLLNEDNFELCDEAVSAAAAGNMKQTDV